MFGSFSDAFCCVPPLYLLINQPLAYYANSPRAIFQRPIVPRKRQEEYNKGEKKAHERKFIHHKLLNLWSLMSRVMLGKGSTPGGQRPWSPGGSHFIVRPFSGTEKTFTDGLHSPCRRFPSLICRWSCQKWPHSLSRTGQCWVVLKKETRTRRQQVVGAVRFTSSERVVHAVKFSRDVHEEIGQS